MKTISFAVPCYNSAEYMDKCIESLLACDDGRGDIEILIVDDGSTKDNTAQKADEWHERYPDTIYAIHKENGGLYTGYNTAYEAIRTELNVCIDSDDAMPPDAVEIILSEWQSRGSESVAGLIGLDVDMDGGKPIGGFFPEGMAECYLLDLYTKRIHRGDSKQVMRTVLMKRVAPQVGFPGEKNFNPIYMLLQVCDDYPLLVVNKPLCLVEYQQNDSMSRNIWRQYFDSPRSFAKMRRLEMHLKRSTALNRIRSAAHYAADSLIAFFKYTIFRKE